MPISHVGRFWAGLGGSGEVPPREARHGVSRTRDPRHSDPEDVGRNAGSAGVAADSGQGSVLSVLPGRLAQAARPNLLHS